MLSSAAIVLAASMVMGQAQKAAEEKPEYDTKLAPIAWLIGEWTSEQKTATGELKRTVKNTYKWRANGKAVLLEVTSTKPDGTPGWSEVFVYFWDAPQKRISRHGVGSMGYVIRGTLMKEDDTGSLWEQRWVFGNGNQGYYKHKIGRQPGEVDSFTKGWTKVSGTGMSNIGPFEFKRVK